jgi:hypothetical protein
MNSQTTYYGEYQISDCRMDDDGTTFHCTITLPYPLEYITLEADAQGWFDLADICPQCGNIHS